MVSDVQDFGAWQGLNLGSLSATVSYALLNGGSVTVLNGVAGRVYRLLRAVLQLTDASVTSLRLIATPSGTSLLQYTTAGLVVVYLDLTGIDLASGDAVVLQNLGPNNMTKTDTIALFYNIR